MVDPNLLVADKENEDETETDLVTSLRLDRLNNWISGLGDKKPNDEKGEAAEEEVLALALDSALSNARVDRDDPLVSFLWGLPSSNSSPLPLSPTPSLS